MLTALLNWPDPDSHQYTAVLLVKLWTLHVDPFTVPKSEQLDRRSALVNLIILQSVEFPSQLRETDSEGKCCTLSGLTLSDARWKSANIILQEYDEIKDSTVKMIFQTTFSVYSQ